MIRDMTAPGKSLNFGSVPYGKNQVMYLCADIRELQEDIGFTPKYSFWEGIQETLCWVKEQHSFEDSREGY